jgi:hypothetical protein
VTADSPWLKLSEAAAYERRPARWLRDDVKKGRVREWLDAHIELTTQPVVVSARRSD